MARQNKLQIISTFLTYIQNPNDDIQHEKASVELNGILESNNWQDLKNLTNMDFIMETANDTRVKPGITLDQIREAYAPLYQSYPALMEILELKVYG